MAVIEEEMAAADTLWENVCVSMAADATAVAAVDAAAANAC